MVNWIKVSRILEQWSRDMLNPSSKVFHRASWGCAIGMAAKWVWDSEQANPWMFAEAPVLTGNPRASAISEADHLEWNKSIVDPDSQIAVKNAKGKRIN